MSGTWHYRIAGEVFGPIPFAELQQLAAAGHLGPSDEVRGDESRGWQRADAVDGLLSPPPSDATSTAAASDFDLDTMLAGAPDVSGPADPSDQASEGDLDSMLASGSGGDVVFGTNHVQGRSADRWYYRVLNQELGPVEFDELIKLVADGSLNPDDEIRSEHSPEWERADTIVGLFPVQPPASAEDSRKTSRSAYSDDEETDWFYQRDGRELGPVTFEGLMEMAHERELSPGDSIRLGRLGDWMEAASMVGLFSDEQLVASGHMSRPEDVSAEPDVVQPEPPPRPESDEDVEDWAAAVLSEPVPEPPPSAEADSTEDAVREPAPARATAARPSTPAVSSAGRQTTAPPPPPPKFKASRTRSAPSLSFSLPDGVRNLFSNPKALAAIGGVAVVGALLAGFFLMGGLFIKGGDLFAETEKIWGQIKPLIEQQAPDSEWTALSSSLSPRIEELAQAAEDEGAGSKQPLLQIVMRLNRDMFPKIMQGRSDTPPASVTAVDTYIEQGHKLLGE